MGSIFFFDRLAGKSNLVGASQKKPRPRAPLFTFDAAMETRSKRRRTEPIVDKIRRGEISVVVAIAEELPDVFAAEILPKLDGRATLNLAQVSKRYNDAVWSVDGVRSLEAKLKVYAERNLPGPCSWLSYAAVFGNVPAIKALLESGYDATNRAYGQNTSHYTRRLFISPLSSVTR